MSSAWGRCPHPLTPLVLRAAVQWSHVELRPRAVGVSVPEEGCEVKDQVHGRSRPGSGEGRLLKSLLSQGHTVCCCSPITITVIQVGIEW